jgi:transposase
MKQKNPYRSVAVKDVDLEALLAAHPGEEVWVGNDVSKGYFLIAPCWGRAEFSRPWRVQFPEELPLLMELLKKLSEQRKLIVAVEPTGTYADPFRWAVTKAKLAVHRVESKASHDHAEVFDKVPSQHDAKDAMVIADLCRDGKSVSWPLELADERQTRMRCLVEVADDQQRALGVWTGRLEAVLARHWPELPRELELTSATLLSALVEYGCPAGMAEDAEAEVKLRKWGGRLLAQEKIVRLIAGSRGTAGVPASGVESECIQRLAQKVLEASRELEQTRQKMGQFVKGDAELERVAAVVGPATTIVLLVMLGHPRDYGSARAYVKAAGLNLAERSSGKYQGQLKISKRGPSVVRRWLYMAAVRLLQKGPAARWYGRKRERDGLRHTCGPKRGKGKIGLVALMRRLLAAVWHVDRKREAFDVDRLFGVRRGKGKGGRRSSPRPAEAMAEV